MRRALPPTQKNEVPENKILMLSDKNDPFAPPSPETFLQYHDKDHCIFFLNSELNLLQNNDWFMDGTFHICKNIKSNSYNQIYIISVLFTSGHRTYTYHVVFCFLTAKDSKSYSFLMNFLFESFFFEKQSNLTQKTIRIDCKKRSFWRSKK